MRIDALRLTAFGPFTGLDLDLSAGRQGLHVIYGPNEAGKSSCLRALGALLYGITPQSPDDFVHEYKQMRIGGLLRLSSGAALDFVRRKALKNSLRDAADDAPLPDDALAPFLGGVDEALFKSLFALDHDRLVEGGHEIARGGGQIGELLFAAGAGVAELRRLQNRLKSETDELFMARGRNPRINQGLTAYRAAREGLKSAQLAVETWQQHDERRRAAQRRAEQLAAQLESLRSEQTRLRRIQSACAAVSQWKEKQVQWREYAAAPQLASDFAERRERTIAELQTAQLACREASAALIRSQSDLQQIEVPEGLLAEADAIDLLKERLGSYRKAMSDRPRVQTELEMATSAERETLQALGHCAGGDDADEWQLPDHVRVAIEQLGRQHAALASAFDAERRECERISREIDKTERELKTESAVPPLARLRASLLRLQQQIDLPQQLQVALQAATASEREALAQQRQLGGWRGTLEQLVQVDVPSEETIDRFEASRARLDARCTKLRDELDDTRREFDGAQVHLQTLDAIVAVPTAEDLAKARSLRDEGWRLVLAQWRNEKSLPIELAAFRDAFPGARDLAEAYARSVAAADEVADRLRGEANRVAEKASLVVRLRQLEDQRGELEHELSATGESMQVWQQEWEQAWAKVVEPGSTGEMRAWRRRQQDVAARVIDLSSQRERARELREQVARAQAAATALLDELRIPAPDADEPLEGLVDTAAARLDELRAAAGHREELNRRLPGLKADLEKATVRRGESEARLAEWREKWARAMGDLRLPAEATIEQAASVLGSLGKLLQHRRDRQNLAHRVHGIDADARQLALDVRATAERLAPDLGERPLEAVVGELSARWNAARESAARRAELSRQADDQAKRQADAQRANDAAAAQLAELCREAGCASGDELREVERRAAQRRDLRRALDALEQQLSAAAAGRELAALVAEVDAEAVDSLPGTIADLDAQVAALSSERDALLETAAAERSELQRMADQAGAIDKAEALESLLARIETDVQRLAVLRLAGAVLRTAVERYREKNQGAVLQYASEIFALLTGGSFTGLRADIDEDQPVLVGVRAIGGKSVHVDGMSEGTCDQLFLALRLASVRAWLADRESLPLVLDDVLVNFDDERTTAALAVLASLATDVQIIFFTHHRHLLDLARATVPAGQLFIHELKSRPDS